MIILQNITKRYGDRYILQEITFNCPAKGRIALIGNNGAGKTTLLNILCGFENDYDGEVIKPRGLRLGYLPQIVNPAPEDTILKEALAGAVQLNAISQEREAVLAKMSSDYTQELFDRYEHLEQMFQSLDGYRIEEDTKDVLRGLGFKDVQFDNKVEQLSGGWRMRLEFAKILLNKPNFLILDEPTNHLDLPSIEWFENYLRKFNGTILFVSHDKDLLNRLATHILHLRQGQISYYTGNFDKFLEEFALKQTQNSQIAKHLSQEYEHIEQFVNRFRASPAKARLVQSRLKTLAKLQILKDNLRVEDLKDTMQLEVENPNPSGKTVLKVEKLVVGYDRPLLKEASFHVVRGQRIAILGANGLGKSTLLRTLLGRQKPLKGEVIWGHNVNAGYFAQEHLDGLDAKLSIVENVRQAAPEIREFAIRSLLGNLGISGDNVFKEINIISGGEKSRSALACMLAKKPNLLFLDEPTNHLDLSACENLANALAEFTGTLIFVSHNRAFISAVATHVIHLGESGVVQLDKMAAQD